MSSNSMLKHIQLVNKLILQTAISWSWYFNHDIHVLYSTAAV